MEVEPDGGMNVEQYQKQYQKIENGRGFIAALDQSGGSTPKALRAYGVSEEDYAGADEMFDLVHAMRTRIITSPRFGGGRIIGAILFENTMDRLIEGRGSAAYLWEVKGVVPFLKVDRGLEGEADGCCLMKPIPDLDGLLERARAHGVFGTKMRSVVKQADTEGIKANVEQQFELGERIFEAGLVPILEPEVDIGSPQKAEAEALLRDTILRRLDRSAPDFRCLFKLTLPEEDDMYLGLVEHPRVLRVVALSGGYDRREACRRLARQRGMTASFSRALAEGLTAGQTDEDFDRTLDGSIAEIYAASST